MQKIKKLQSVKMNQIRTVAVLLIVVVLGACGTYRGVAEFSSYREAYASAAGVGNSLLDRLAVAERSLYETAHPFHPKRSPFNPELAAYYVEVVDPPATSAYRRTLSAVTAYNDGLHALASGDDAAALAGKITRLSAIGAGAAADAAALAGAGVGSALPAEVVAAQTVNTVLAALEPLTAQVIAFRTRSEFRTKLVEQAPIIREAIIEVRKSTPKVFDMLRTNVTTAVDADPQRFGDLTDAERREIRRARTLVATWVVLMDASLAALDVTVKAVEEDAGAGSFDGVLLAGEQLAGAVSAARRNLAGGD